MAKSLCHLLMKVSRFIVANIYDANTAIRENKILAKISEFTVCANKIKPYQSAPGAFCLLTSAFICYLSKAYMD